MHLDYDKYAPLKRKSHVNFHARAFSLQSFIFVFSFFLFFVNFFRSCFYRLKILLVYESFRRELKNGRYAMCTELLSNEIEILKNK